MWAFSATSSALINWEKKKGGMKNNLIYSPLFVATLTPSRALAQLAHVIKIDH